MLLFHYHYLDYSNGEFQYFIANDHFYNKIISQSGIMQKMCGTLYLQYTSLIMCGYVFPLHWWWLHCSWRCHSEWWWVVPHFWLNLFQNPLDLLEDLANQWFYLGFLYLQQLFLKARIWCLLSNNFPVLEQFRVAPLLLELSLWISPLTYQLWMSLRKAVSYRICILDMLFAAI